MVSERGSSDWALAARTGIPDDPPQAQSLRRALVRDLVAFGDVTIPSVIEALRLVPRHLFVPSSSLLRAYVNRPLPIGSGQTISQPSIVARMTEALDLKGHERVLEIGTGCGYQTAILATLAREVFSVERIEVLGTSAIERFQRLGYTNVHVRVGDGFLGWPEAAPFDRIIITAAPEELPVALLPQLADGGILVAPIGHATHARLGRLHKSAGAFAIEDLGGCSFVEMLPGVERNAVS